MASRPAPRPSEIPEVPLPRYHQVYVVLRQQILEGFYAPDRPMPGEHELGALFSVSRITIRRALDRLEGEGLVTRSQGRGTFAQAPMAVAPLRANLRGLLENLLAMGLQTKVRLIEFGYVAAPPDVASQLGVAPSTPVQKAVRVRCHGETPFSHLTTYVPEDVGRSYGEADLAERPLLALLERAGVTVTRADQSITAKLADTAAAPLLEVEVGAALLCVRRCVRDQNDRVVEYIEALYRPDRYEYHMTMSRVSEAGRAHWTPDPGPGV